jgi:hypothetical protein
MPAFRDDFDGDALDPAVWDPHHRPAWGPPTDTVSRHRVAESRLRLWIPPDQHLWCPEQQPGPVRVSGVVSQGAWLPAQGSLAVVCRMELSDRAMATISLSGLGETPADSGQLCLVEVYGKDRVPRRAAAVGMGIKQGTDPRLERDFSAPQLEIDVGQWHEYAVRWDEQVAEFSVDGELVRSCVRPPTYPMRIMISLFDHPDWFGDAAVPALEVEWIGGETP